MKKKVGIILVILVIVALAIVLGCILKFSKEEIEIENKGRILVEDAYCNYAWGYYYTGSAIFEDGSIYSWNFGNEDYEKESDNTIETQIKKKGKLESKRVSDDDLKKLYKLIKEVDDSIEYEHVACDAGSNYIAVYDYDRSNNRIILEESGDIEGENTTKEAKEIKSIISKYLD